MNTDSAREANRQMVEDEADTHLHMIIDREIADMMELAPGFAVGVWDSSSRCRRRA